MVRLRPNLAPRLSLLHAHSSGGPSQEEADVYVSAMPVDIVKRYVPEKWQPMPFFRQFDELEGIPVINIHLW